MSHYQLSILLAAACGLAVLTPAEAATYRWRDADGGLHFSNRPSQVPPAARIVEPPALGSSVRARPLLGRGPAATTVSRSARPRACAPADATGLADRIGRSLRGQGHLEGSTSGLAEGVVARLSTGQLEGVELYVDSVPVAYRPGDVLVEHRFAEDQYSPRTAALEDAAVAFPRRAECPTEPPLPRYRVGAEGEPTGDPLCADFRRAFAEVGMAASRDDGVARSFRAIAERYVRVRQEGYEVRQRAPATVVALRPDASDIGTSLGDAAVLYPAEAYGRDVEAPGEGVSLPPWLVEVHIAQLDALADETAAYVEELRVALEEIDVAARARGCW